MGDGGDGDDSIVGACGGNLVLGAVNIGNSSGSVELGGDTVRGAVTLTGTTGLAAELEQNHVTGPLLCSGNVPAPTDGGQPNGASFKGGQCGAPGF